MSTDTIAPSIASASFYKTFARFNLCSSAKEWQLVLHGTLPDGSRFTLSETMGEDSDEPEPECPSHCFALIEERSKSYWIDTGKSKKEAERERIRPHLPTLDAAWAKKRAEKLRKEADNLIATYCEEA